MKGIFQEKIVFLQLPPNLLGILSRPPNSNPALLNLIKNPLTV